MTSFQVASSAFAMILSLTFAVSAAGKIMDLPGTRMGLRSLQIPLVPWHGALAVPVAELFVAFGLWVPWQPVALVASGIGVAMMLAFTVVIARALMFEDAVHCACFGTLGSPTVTRATLARNILLVVLAIVALLAAIFGVFPGAVGARNPLAAVALVVAVLASAAVAVLVMGGTNRLAGERTASSTGSHSTTGGAAYAGASSADTVTGSASSREDADSEVLEADYLRTPIPYASLVPDGGELVTLRSMARGRAVLLLFLSSGCGSCTTLFPKVPGWRDQLSEFVTVATVLSGGARPLDQVQAEHLAGTVHDDPDHNAATMFELRGRPAAVLLGADELLAGGPVSGAGSVTEFVEQIIEQVAGALAEAQPEADGEGAGAASVGPTR